MTALRDEGDERSESHAGREPTGRRRPGRVFASHARLGVSFGALAEPVTGVVASIALSICALTRERHSLRRALSLPVVTRGAAIVKRPDASPARVRPMRRRLLWETGRVERGASDDRSERECRHRPRAG